MDALRGAAAMAVMLHHAPGNPLFDMPGGFFAVDLFFILSGFVMAASYEERLRSGMRLGHFMRLRAARLWPMLVLGALLGIVLHGGHAGMLFLLPNLKSPTLLYPGNPSLWSLFYEAIAYLCFAVWLFRQRGRTLFIVCLASLVIIVTIAADPHAFRILGNEWATLLGGFPRVIFGFTAGMLIFRWRSRQGMARKTSRLAWLVPAGIVALLIVVPLDRPLATLVALAALVGAVWLASVFELPRARTAQTLAAVSYPLYCIHRPILEALDRTGASLLLLMAAIVLVSLALDRFVDRPARAWLARQANASQARRELAIAERA